MRSRGLVVAAIAAGVAQALAPANEARAQQLEEITVTATRQELNLQDAPLAVVALSGENLEMQNIDNMEKLNAVVPNVVIAGTNGGTNTASFYMRGIPNVGTYIDGIWQVSNSGLLLREFVDLQRVEVLRGPQGTLYGRDSTGGAIRLYTEEPADDFGAQIDVRLGTYDRRDVKAIVDVPFSENFKSRFTAAQYQREGYVTSVTTGFKTGGVDDTALRADFMWEPSDRISLRFNAMSDELVAAAPRVQTYIEPRTAYNQGFQVGIAEAYDIASGGNYRSETSVAGFPGGELGEWETRSEITVPSRQWLEQQSIDLNVDLTDNVHFQYLYGDTESISWDYLDWDGSEYNFYNDYFNNKTEMQSHEIQFTGANDRFSWVGGLYYWEEETRARNPAWAMREWAETPTYGTEPEFSYQNQVLTSAACQRTPAEVEAMFDNVDVPTLPGVDPNTEAAWPFPCEGPFGNGWVDLFSLGANNPGDSLSQNRQDGYAAFGEVVVSATEQLDITLGYRFHDQSVTENDLEITPGVTAPKPSGPNTEWTQGGVFASAGPEGPIDEVDFDASTTRFAANYHFTPTISAYFGYSEGFNAGGLGTVTLGDGTRVTSQYEPERLENTELGIRSEMLDGRLRFNATYFTTDWENIQFGALVTDPNTGQTLTETIEANMASATAEGVEIEMNFAATENLILNANLGFLDTGFNDVSTPDIGVPLATTVETDTEFARAPDETINLGFQHNAQLANGGMFTTRFDASFTGAYWRADIPTFRQNAYGIPADFESGDYWLVNTRLVYTPPDGNYEVALFGRNLLDERYVNSGFFDGPWQFDFGTVGRRREAGVQMRVFF